MPRQSTASKTTRHRRINGAVRRLPSGRWQARYTGPDGVSRPLGTFATKDEADLAIAGQSVDVARGDWVNPTAGTITLGAYLATWIATRDLAESTRALYRRLAETWINADVPGLDLGDGPVGTIHLGRHPIGALSLPVVREWDAAVLAEATRRATARWDKARRRPGNVNASIRRWAARNDVAIAATGRIPAGVREAWASATGGLPDAVKPGYRNAGRTESAQAYRLLRAALSQALADRTITENPCRVEGAGTRDNTERAERRIATPAEMWTLADLMPARYRAHFPASRARRPFALIVLGVVGLLATPQVEGHHRRGGVQRHRRRAVEQAGQVPGDHAAQRVGDLTSVVGESFVVPRVGLQQPVDDGRQDRGLHGGGRRGQGQVDGGVLDRGQVSCEHGGGQRADQVASSGGHLHLP